MTENDYELIEREILYQGVFRLVRLTLKHRLFEGGYSTPIRRELLERRPAVAVLPYDPIFDRVILIEQFRPGGLERNNPWLIEIPAGVFGKNEKPEEVAHRETMEEANCKILELTSICEFFVSPGGTNEYLNLYYGRIDSQGIEGYYGLKNEQEDIRVINISADEAFDLLNQGEIKTAPAIIALLWLQLNRERLMSSCKNDRT